MTPRYATFPWPLTVVLIVLALIGQEMLLRGLRAEPSIVQSSYRVLVMSLGAISLALLIMPMRRSAYLLGFLVCAGLMTWAFWLQYGEGLEPCPLCMFQRVAVCAVGVAFLIAFLQNPGRRGAAVYAFLTLLFAGAGAAFAARQIWLQSLPKDQVPACGMGLNYMLDTMRITDVIAKVLGGSGECAEKGWELLGLSIAGWTFVFFVTMIVAAFAAIRRDY
jgi:disulfide bond formation protein DsbB